MRYQVFCLLIAFNLQLLASSEDKKAFKTVKSKKIIHKNDTDVKKAHKRQLNFGGSFGGRDRSFRATSVSNFGPVATHYKTSNLDDHHHQSDSKSREKSTFGTSHSFGHFPGGRTKTITTTTTRYHSNINGPTSISGYQSHGKNHFMQPEWDRTRESGEKQAGPKIISYSRHRYHDRPTESHTNLDLFDLEKIADEIREENEFISADKNKGATGNTDIDEKMFRNKFKVDPAEDDEFGSLSELQKVADELTSNPHNSQEPFITSTPSPWTLIQMAQMLKSSNSVYYATINKPLKNGQEYLSTFIGKPTILKTNQQNNNIPFVIILSEWKDHPEICDQNICKLLLVGNVSYGKLHARGWRSEVNDESANETYQKLMALSDFVHDYPK